ncbi:hypothetical protein Bca101_081616 [Brassica carinata]
MVRVQRYLPIGEWKVIDTFKIGGAGGQYRPTKQQYKMTILTGTMISRSDYLNDSEFLDLASYEEIGNGMCKPNFLIDVIGQVTDLAAVATVQVKGIDTKRVNFRLRDESGNEVACCLWGKYAEKFEKHIEETTADIEICLIRWKVEVKVLRLWTQHFAGQETFEFVVEDKMCTCKGLFLERVKKLQIGQWRYLGNFTLYLNIGIRRQTSHKFKIRITADSIVTKSPVNTYEVHLIDHNIEGSSGDVSTSCSKRKEGDADLNDMNSTSKKLCAKKLIMEKTEED